MRRLASLVLAGAMALPAFAGSDKPKPKPAAKGPGVKVGPAQPSQLPAATPFVTINGETIPVSIYVDRLSVKCARS